MKFESGVGKERTRGNLSRSAAAFVVIPLALVSAGCGGSRAEDEPSRHPYEIPDAVGILSTLDAASAALGEITGIEVRSYCTFDFGRARDSACRSVIVHERHAAALVFDLRPHLGDGLVAFAGTGRWLGDEVHEGVELAVGRGTDQFDILRLARSDAINYGLETEDLIARLRSYDERFGIDIFHAETDTIQFRFVSEPNDWGAFAEELYDFCPDIVDQGVGTVQALERELRTSRVAFLWWD